MPLINPPFSLFSNVDGEELHSGYLYFGVANQNPETNPITVYWDKTGLIPAAQPIRTLHGFPVRNGSVSKIYALTDFSITVRDSKRRLVFSSPANNALSADQILFLQAGVGAVARDLNLAVGDVADVRSFGCACDYTGPGIGTDDTVNLRKAFIALQAGFFKTLRARGRIRIYSDTGDIAVLADLLNLDGITLDFANADFVVDRAFAVAVRVNLIKFTACSNITVTGFKGSCPNGPGSGVFDRGPHAFEFLQGCKNINFGTIDFRNYSYGIRFIKEIADPVSYQSRNINIDLINAVTTYYPLLLTDSGSNIRARVMGEDCGRLMLAHVDALNQLTDIEVDVTTKNHTSTGAVVLQAAAGGVMGPGIKIKLNNTETTTADLTLNNVLLEWEHEIASTIQGVDVELNVRGGNTGYSGWGLIARKLNNANGPDPIDRGHIARKINVHGFMLSSTSNQRSIVMFGNGGGGPEIWGPGENVYNVIVGPLHLEGCGQPGFRLESLKTLAHFHDIYSDNALNVSGPASSNRVTFKNVNVTEVCFSAADTSFMDYASCNIRIGALQSVINKSFINTFVAGALFSPGPGRFPTIPAIGAVAYNAVGTAVNHVNGTLYVSEIFVPRDVTLAGIAMLNGGTVGTNLRVVGLYDSTGALVISSNLAGTLSAGANTFQSIPFTVPYVARAGQYFLAVQANGNTDNLRAIAANTYQDNRTISRAGVFGSFGTLAPLPTVVVADVGPIAYAYA